MLAMQAAGSSDSQKMKAKVFDVANAPGTKIHPGELGKAQKILADGGEIDYVGAREIELIGLVRLAVLILSRSFRTASSRQSTHTKRLNVKGDPELHLWIACLF